MKSYAAVILVCVAGMLTGVVSRSAAQGLVVTYGAQGVQQLSYRGVQLENLAQFPGDAFHIGHMKATNLAGAVLSGGQFDWGENQTGKSWNAADHTWTYNYSWGTIQVAFAQAGDRLDMTVTTVNHAASGIVFDGATIYPFALHFPKLPAGFTDAAYEQLAFNTTAPSVTLADYGQGEVAAVYPSAAGTLYTGYQPTGAANTYFPIISGTSIDGMATFFPRNDRPVSPGQTDRFTVSLRFAASGTPASVLGEDAFVNWTQAHPARLNWADRRIIGTVYLASSPNGNPNMAGGYPNNPRRYYNDSKPQDFDVRTPAGLGQFQARILQQAHSNVQNLEQLAAQGAITWDLEGEQYPQPTSYACAPDQIGQLAPEMESVIAMPDSPYRGMKLDDAYFKIMRDAGFKVGVCVRPQHFAVNGNGTASQVTLPNSQVAGELIRKMRYAHDRWGATLFYLDSTVDANGGTLPANVIEQAAAALPDALLIPEETTPNFYAFAAPFQTFIFHNDLGTAAAVYGSYPKAFSVNLINDVNPDKLAQYRQQITESVRRGDILMVHADYWQANNPTVVQIYMDAGRTSTSLVP